jgi:hypothetical protein
MSFSIQLHSDNSYNGISTNNVTYLFNFSQVFVEPGKYKLTWSFRATPGTAIAYYPNINLDFGTLGSSYVAGSTNNSTIKTLLIGTLNYNRYMTGTSDYYYNCNLNDNPPIIFDSINCSANYIRVFMTQPGTTNTLIGNATGPYVLNLFFEKI